MRIYIDRHVRKCRERDLALAAKWRKAQAARVPSRFYVQRYIKRHKSRKNENALILYAPLLCFTNRTINLLQNGIGIFLWKVVLK